VRDSESCRQDRTAHAVRNAVRNSQDTVIPPVMWKLASVRAPPFSPRGSEVAATCSRFSIMTDSPNVTITGPDALVLNEAVSNYHVVNEHLRASRPGSLLSSGGACMGWSGGAAVGAALAAPGRTVVSLVGDGCYLSGVPSSTQWMARRYRAPSLTVIFDIQGWKTPSRSTQAVHPAGLVAGGGFAASFRPAAGGAYARTVAAADLLPVTLRRALEHVRDGRPAVISARVAPVCERKPPWPG
jgi:thiamine pyrophosphate-dependent acetolactate synthase large subunit-like protein